jgi:hypothetical protein
MTTHKLLVAESVRVEHTTLDVDGKVFVLPCRLVISVETEREALEPVESLISVLQSLLRRDCLLDDSVALGGKLVSPVAKGRLVESRGELERRQLRWGSGSSRVDCNGHFE